jgi:hypothetical protein
VARLNALRSQCATAGHDGILLDRNGAAHARPQAIEIPPPGMGAGSLPEIVCVAIVGPLCHVKSVNESTCLLAHLPVSGRRVSMAASRHRGKANPEDAHGAALAQPVEHIIRN